MSSYDLLPKIFVLNGTVKATGTSANLTAGEFGLYSPKTHEVITAGNAASHPAAYVATGSYYASDRIGDLHGGYKESDKSPAPTKGIDPKRVSRFYKVAPQTAQNQVVRLFWNGVAGQAATQFLCGKTYYVRLELKGEPILRFINRYLYKQFGVHTGCCNNDCSAPCTDEVVDAAIVMKGYADQMNADPLFSKFITVAAQYNNAGTATDVTGAYVSPALPADKALVLAGLLITVNYSETKFADCSFNQADYYNQAFIEVLASMVDQNNDPCEHGGVKMNSITGEKFYEITPFKTPGGLGEQVIREFITDQTQKGIFFSHIPRDRETTGNIALTAVDRSATYQKYFLIYQVSTRGNASNTFSQDQYILTFNIKTGTSVTAFEALMLAYLQAHNPSLTLELVA